MPTSGSVIQLPSKAFELRHRLESNAGIETWSATCVDSGEAVVAKLSSAAPGNANRENLLWQEASILSELRSRYFAPLVSFGRHENGLALVTALLPGETLEDKARRRPLSPAEAIHVGHAVASALEELHALGYSHGDLKPAHVLIDGAAVAVCDFGLSYRMQADSESAVGATVLFAAPEQLGLIRAKLSPAADLFSLGLLLRWAIDPASVERRAVFDIESDDFAPSVRLPRGLYDVVRRLTKADPAERYATASGARHDLEELLLDPRRELVLGRRDQRGTLAEPSLVGRADSARRLESRLRESSGLVLIGARSGMGKSRLLRTLAESCQRDGCTVFLGQGVASNGGTAFPIWDPLSRQIGGWASARPELVALVRAHMGERCDILAQAFPGFRPLFEVPSRPEVHPQETVLESLFMLVALLRERERLLLFFDDVQWADFFTLAYLRADPSGTLAAFRTEELSSDHPLLVDEPDIDQLLPLSDGESRAVLESMAGPLPEPAVASILKAASGEPFLLQSLLRGAVEDQSLTPTAEGWQWTAPNAALTSDRRAGWLLSGRLQSLSREERAFLEVGAVLGRSFSLPLASHLAEASVQAGVTLLDGAVQRGLIRLDGQQATFTHDKIREALLELRGAAQDASVHTRAALWYEQNEPGAIRDLALHWYHGGEVEKAMPYALATAAEARLRMDYAEASAFYRLALEVTVEKLTPLKHRRLLKSLALTLGSSDDLRGVRDAYQEALKAHHDPDNDRAELLAGFADQLARLNEAHEANRVGGEAFKIMGAPQPGSRNRIVLHSAGMLSKLVYRYLRSQWTAPSDEELRRVELCESQLEASTRSMRMELFLWCLCRGLLDLRDKEPRPQGSRLVMYASQMAAVFGLHKLAAEFRHRGLEGGRLRPRTRAHVTGQAGLGMLMEGNIRGALQQFEEAMPLCRLCNDAWNLAVCQHHAAMAYYMLGEVEQAEAIATIVLTRKVHGDSSNSIAGGRILALLGRASGFEAAVDFHEQELRDTVFSSLGYQAQGVMALRKENWAQAIDRLERARSTHSVLLGPHSVGAAAWLACACRTWAEKLPPEKSAQRKSLLRQAARAAGTALKITSRFPVCQPHALREYALSSAHAGRFYLARANFEKAHQIATKLDMKMEAAWTLYERGRFAEVAGWSDWKADAGEGLLRLRRLGAWVPGLDLSAQAPQQHLARLDRFDRVLEGGRRLVLLERQEQIREGLQDEARTLLRCNKVLLIATPQDDPEVSRTLYSRCLEEGRAVTESEVEEPSRSLLLHEARSTLMAPLRVADETVGVLVAWQKSVGGFFGEEETRLADYLCTLAGAALENARILDERDQTFAALATSEQRFRGFFDYAGVGTALLDERGRTVEENPYLPVLLGASTLGKTPWEYCHARDRETLKAGFASLERDQHRFDAEIRLHRGGGEVAWTQTCLARLPLRDGDESRYLMTVADTTHRRIAEMMTFLENERRGLAAEVHDELAQNISALHMLLSGFESEETPVLKARALAKRLLDDACTLIASLRNPLAEGVDLLSALKDLVTEFSVSEECEMVVKWPSHPPLLSDLGNLVLYRVLQEGLSNIAKHSQANLVGLEFQLDTNLLLMKLWDNGQGFDVDSWLGRRAVQKHFGLLGMRDRVEMVGGSLTLDSIPHQQTSLSVTLPLSKNHHWAV